MIVVVNPIWGWARISEISECRMSDDTQAAQGQFSRQYRIINITIFVSCCVTSSFNGTTVYVGSQTYVKCCVTTVGSKIIKVCRYGIATD